MGGWFGPPDYLRCCCGTVLSCADCEDTYPEEVSVLIPSLGISDTAYLISHGAAAFLYGWEGGNETWSWQADFACENINFGVAKFDLSYTCIADNGPPSTVQVEIVSCYPDQFQVIYTFECVDGGSLEVILLGP